ncbi:MAG: hypothetical protein WC648_05110 [Candidatus Paceibacterota bacterium]|jgi:hypothetical protein
MADSERLTDEQLEAIAARCEAATAGQRLGLQDALDSAALRHLPALLAEVVALRLRVVALEVECNQQAEIVLAGYERSERAEDTVALLRKERRSLRADLATEQARFDATVKSFDNAMKDFYTEHEHNKALREALVSARTALSMAASCWAGAEPVFDKDRDYLKQVHTVIAGALAGEKGQK